jgi:hypothetical protein
LIRGRADQKGEKPMKVRLVSCVLVGAIAATLAGFASTASAATVAAPPSSGTSLAVPISFAQSGGLLNGVFTVTSFSVNSARQLVANGTFTGTAVTAAGPTQVTDTPASTVVAAQGSCRILDLTLGPLHLDLLGLVVDLNQVHLTITAQQGPGNLLGNLLCAVAHLLDSNSSPNALQQIINLLNQIVARL